MRQRIKKILLIFAGFCLLGMPMEVLAATKPINTVNVKVSSDLKAGEPLPNIEVGGQSASNGSVAVTQSGSHYTVTQAEWVDKASKGVSTAEEPRMKVVLEPEDVSEYYFLASYKESNIKISGGTFVSAKRDGDSLVVTLRVKPVKGEFDTPKDAYWNENTLGQARWKEGENDSGYYELQLLRDNKNVFKVEQTTGKQYNFYPYMTEAGDYSFKVRTIPGTDMQEKYGKKSEWVESGELQITERYVSDGKGKQSENPSAERGTDKEVGWFEHDSFWSYRYPDGNLCRGWGNFNSLWYYFDAEGNMLTGWQQIGDLYYYFHQDGQMALGWTKLGNTWYYLRPEEEGRFPVGSMVSSGWKTVGADYYYFNADGTLYTGWLELDGKRYYLNTLENSLEGAMFTGWIQRDEKTYFADSNGQIVEGWYKIDNLWYYFYPGSGEMAHDTQIDGLFVGSDGVWR